MDRVRRRAMLRAMRLLLRPAEPRTVALGAAIGIFVATTPTLGFQMVLAIALAGLTGANRLAAATFVWVANPVFFYIDYRIGRWLLEWTDLVPFGRLSLSWTEIGAAGTELLLPVVLGAVVFGTAAGVFTYAAGVPLARHLQRRLNARKEVQSERA